MKKFLQPTLVLLVAASLFTAQSAIAEPHRDDRGRHKGPPSVEEMLARISESLDLSDEQSAEMLVILQQQEQDRKALHEQTMAIMGAEICAQNAEAEEAIISILDPQQTELFLQMKEQRQARADGRNHHWKGKDLPDCSEYGVSDS